MDDNTRVFIDFLKTIPKKFDSAEKLLFQGDIKEIVEFLNLHWGDSSTLNFSWNPENLKNCLYKICSNQRKRIYDILLARILEKEIF